MQVSIEGGEPARIPVTFESPVVYDISPSRSELVVGEGASGFSEIERPLWVVPLRAGAPHRVGDVLAHDACWTIDGRSLIFINDRDIFIAKPDGSEVHKIASANALVEWIGLAPDGTRLRFCVHNKSGFDVMEMKVDGTGLHRLPIQGAAGSWSVDGNYYYHSPEHDYRDIWVLPERRSIFGGVTYGNPVQLTAGPIAFDAMTVGADGKRIFAIGKQPRIELVHYQAESKQFVPFLGGISAGELEVSPDGQWVTYTTFPESTLWRSRLDGSERLQLTFAPMNAHEPRWSPDGKQILFTDFPDKIFVVPAAGGAPRQLMPDKHTNIMGAGAWSPEGNSIVFTSDMECPLNDSHCYLENESIYRLDLKTQQISKIPGSNAMGCSRLSRNGRYLTALTMDHEKVMLYDFRTQRWSELAQAYGAIVWSHDSNFVYLRVKNGTQPPELIRISVQVAESKRSST